MIPKSQFSVHWCWVKSQRQSFGWTRRGELCCFAGQRERDIAGSCPQNCVSPLGENIERFYSNCSKKTWSAHGHPSDGLMVSEVSEGQHHQLSDPTSLGSTCLWAAHHPWSLTSPPEGGFSICKITQTYFCVYPLMGNRTLSETYSWLFLLVSHLFCPVINNCLDLPIETQRRSWRLNEGCFLKSKKWGTQKVSVPRNPRGPCVVSFWPRFLEIRCFFSPVVQVLPKNLASVHQNQVKCGDSALEK